MKPSWGSVCGLLLVMACSASVFQSRDVVLEKGGTSVMIRHETGAIIVGKTNTPEFRQRIPDS